MEFKPELIGDAAPEMLVRWRADGRGQREAVLMPVGALPTELVNASAVRNVPKIANAEPPPLPAPLLAMFDGPFGRILTAATAAAPADPRGPRPSDSSSCRCC